MNKYYCRPCGVSMHRSDSDPNDKCMACHKPALKISEDNWKEGVGKTEVWSVYCKKCFKEDSFMPYHDTFECAECKGITYGKTLGRPKISRFSEKFPYYDRGLGMWLKSVPHRRQVMKEKGLIEAPGEWTSADMVDKKALKEAKEDKEIVSKLEKDMKENPAFAEYRERKNDIKFKHKPRS